MENINTYFNELNNDISTAKTKKVLKVFSRRAKRLYRNLTDNSMTQSIKKQVTKQYKNSMNLIKQMNNQITI